MIKLSNISVSQQLSKNNVLTSGYAFTISLFILLFTKLAASPLASRGFAPRGNKKNYLWRYPHKF